MTPPYRVRWDSDTGISKNPQDGRHGRPLERRPYGEVQVQAPAGFRRNRADGPALLQRIEHALWRPEIQGRRIELIADGELDRPNHRLVSDPRSDGGVVVVLVELSRVLRESAIGRPDSARIEEQE